MFMLRLSVGAESSQKTMFCRSGAGEERGKKEIDELRIKGDGWEMNA